MQKNHTINIHHAQKRIVDKADKIMNRIKLIQLVKEVIAEQKLNEGPLTTQVLKTAKDAIDSGSEVTVMGKPIGKIIINRHTKKLNSDLLIKEMKSKFGIKRINYIF